MRHSSGYCPAREQIAEDLVVLGAERAAIFLAEHLTRPVGGVVPAAVQAEMLRHLGEAAAAQVIWTVAAVNAWNRVGIATADSAAGRRPAARDGS